MATVPACKHTSRTKPSLRVEKEVEEAISKDFRTPLPLLESLLIDNVYTRHYSLAANEYLRSRWLVYKDTIASRVHEPFKFYDKRNEDELGIWTSQEVEHLGSVCGRVGNIAEKRMCTNWEYGHSEPEDVHFFLCDSRYIPSQSIHTKTDLGKKLVPGPGVDFKGQKPIPDDMQVRKFDLVPRKYPKRYPKATKVDKKAK